MIAKSFPPSMVCERTSTGTFQFTKPANSSELSIEVKGQRYKYMGAGYWQAGVTNMGRVG